MLQVGVMLGVFVGAIGFGRMSDTMGRRPCIMWALITCFMGMILSSFAPGSYIYTLCYINDDHKGETLVIGYYFFYEQ